jgi:PadR family transcriptional regulator PadR
MATIAKAPARTPPRRFVLPVRQPRSTALALWTSAQVDVRAVRAVLLSALGTSQDVDNLQMIGSGLVRTSDNLLPVGIHESRYRAVASAHRSLLVEDLCHGRFREPDDARDLCLRSALTDGLNDPGVAMGPGLLRLLRHLMGAPRASLEFFLGHSAWIRVYRGLPLSHRDLWDLRILGQTLCRIPTMAGTPRMTTQTLQIIKTVLDRPSDEWYGLEIAQATGLKSGTMYPALIRLEDAGWLESYWEDVDPVKEKRPRRRLYHLTPAGHTAAIEAMNDHLSRVVPASAGRIGVLKPRVRGI